ncbi:MAG TPA: PAS domain S-box protein [Blastocatellia bacterium]
MRILLVDDDEDDYIITRDLLSEIDGTDFDLEWIASYNGALEAIGSGKHHIYLFDYGLGERTGLDLLREAIRTGCRGPIILLTGQGHHEVDVEAMKSGAADYLVKGQITPALLGRSIRYAIERSQVLEALRDSETQYRRLFRDNPVPMWLYDVDTLEFLAINDAAEKTYLYSREEFCGMTLMAIQTDSDIDRMRSLVRNAPERRGPLKTRHKRKDNSILDVEITSHEVSFAGRQARLVIANDITQQKQVEDALRKSEEHFRALTENALDLIHIVGDDGTIRYHSPSAERVSGFPAPDVEGHSALEFLHPDDIPECVAACELMSRNPGFAISVEFRFRHKNGSWRRLEAIARRPDGDSPGGIIVNSRDVTERKALQEHLIQSEKLAALGRLVSGVAHELNNPLTSVIGYTQLLLSQNDLEQDLRERLEIVDQEGQRARRIVQNMLSFARQHKPVRSGVNLNHLLDATLELRSYEFEVHNIRINRNFGELPEIVGDPHLLQQVFMNILINAEQSMRTSKRGGCLSVKTEQKEIDGASWATVAITDDGPGIPAEVMSRIFDPFFTTKDVGEGTGMGLSISYGIIKEHGGLIRAESTPSTGATFIVELPSKAPLQTEIIRQLRNESVA